MKGSRTRAAGAPALTAILAAALGALLAAGCSGGGDGSADGDDETTEQETEQDADVAEPPATSESEAGSWNQMLWNRGVWQ